tara:strand:+ start:662 stop:1276 length:615 start_codon:yes stop_codon:yes gene_type:complete
MAIFKPEINTEFTNESNKFLGICRFAIVNYEDKSGSFDWADLYLDIEVKQEFSDYTRSLQIKGSFERDGNQLITGGSVLKRLYTFFDAIGCTAGINVNGTWEDSEGNEIESIKEYLAKDFIAKPNSDYEPSSYDYIAYFYKEKPKKPGAKSYTNVWPKVYKYSEENKVKLKKDIDWLKGKGYLKELTDEENNAPKITGNGLANL